MMFPKPKDMKYTDMSKYFDEHFWLEGEGYDEFTCYKYLYLIIDMLAHTRDLFKLYKDFEKFDMFATNTLYMRFLKKKRRGNARVKSVLNYVKSTVNPLKIMYLEQEYSSSVINCNDDNSKIDYSQMKEYLRAPVREQYNKEIENAINELFKELPEIITQVVKNTPYKKDKITLRNLEISCILTLFKSFKLSDKSMDKLLKNQQLEKSELLFSEEREKSLTLFRLDEDMRDTVKFLCNKIRKLFSEKIMGAIQDNTVRDETIDSILTTAWDATNHYDNNSNLTYGDDD